MKHAANGKVYLQKAEKNTGVKTVCSLLAWVLFFCCFSCRVSADDPEVKSDERCSVSGAAVAIRALTAEGSPHTVVLYGALGTADISVIKKALIAAGNAGAKVALDMGMCTGLDSMPLFAFSGCSGLTSVVLPGSITNIEQFAFYGCSSLASVEIPGGVTGIGIFAFYGCSSLTSVTIPGSTMNIGNGVFFGCSSLASVSVDGSNAAYKDIDGVVFTKDEKTLVCYPPGKGNTVYTIPNGTEDIAIQAFLFCAGLESVVIPGSVTDIGNDAFASCSSLTSVTIPAGVTSIGMSAFEGCSSLTSVEIPAGVTSIGRAVFQNCSSLRSVTIPGSVTDIESYAFEGCSSLTSVTIPAGVTGIGMSAFGSCSSLAAISVDGSNAVYKDIGGVVFTKDEKTLVCYPPGKAAGEYSIPDCTTGIGAWAFASCAGLESVVLPDNVTAIGNGAFYGCSGLTSVEIPAGVTGIGDLAFSGCSGLTSVTIPAGVTVIGYWVFHGCSALTSLTFSDPDNWYRTTSLSDWSNKTDGTLTDLRDVSANVAYFKSPSFIYWYKL